MARNTSVVLGKYYDQFVEEQVNTGRYQSVSELIRDALRRLEKANKREEFLDRLDDIELAKIVEERRGQKGITVDFDDL
ncbi:type II toxin-antitoxin system ParD family antitoxin [Endozoicomonas euniceicola]|uniref:Antitoxin ParD n=1 Tax=Endozoicomonas euniceicola TaxID=1234143 RepID=A0ABY6GN43_9GAMM|nr:type II toxin-antitoxin system ParD family antitoxin [Endozoicomonas euniceicola]UYM13937.1 type II toxin-antitoxin system ParD family antitoxin [Endozoicomonas euniceicola]